MTALNFSFLGLLSSLYALLRLALTLATEGPSSVTQAMQCNAMTPGCATAPSSPPRKEM